MKKLKEKFEEMSISNKLVFYFLIIFALFAILLYKIIPIILSYPPGAINSQFDKEVSILYYKYQFLLVVVGIAIFFTAYLKIRLRRTDKWWKNRNTDISEIEKIRNQALKFPYTLYVSMEIVPTLILLIILSVTGSHPAILLFKMGTIIFSFSTFIASIFLLLTTRTFYPILVETSKYFATDNKPKKTQSLKVKLIFQLFPSVLVIALILSLFGYYRLTVEKETLLHSYYASSLANSMDEIIENPDINNVKNILSKYFNLDTTFCFIEKPSGVIETSNGTTLSHFFIKYMHDLAPQYNNTVYESYTIDSQAVIQKFEYNGQIYTVGIYYEIASFTTFLQLLILAFVLFLFALLTIYLISSSLVRNIGNVSKRLHDIADKDLSETSKLPITSNDELGELENELNVVQDLNIQYINQIKNNQDTLMEKERLASLGQLIGGISHNLKTPIMSISGAAEGLTDLINEYDTSIGDPEVTNDDHHAIANDMRDWITKIHSYTSYMSDIITAVKGQAVNLSENESDVFTIDEMIKRVTILMKHEIRNASLTLNTQINVPSTTSLHGDVNSLVQVINNLITNAIQSYNGKKDNTIDLSVNLDGKNVVISVADHGCGMTKEVQDKLFKSMITTKGKNGTGLGMFMSYSTIKGHFNGDITFETEIGKGTKFNVIIPL